MVTIEEVKDLLSRGYDPRSTVNKLNTMFTSETTDTVSTDDPAEETTTTSSPKKETRGGKIRRKTR